VSSSSTPETAHASSRRSPSPQKMINIADHIFEHAVLFRTSSRSPSPPGATASSPPSDFSARARRRWPNPSHCELSLLLSVNRQIQILWLGIDHLTNRYQ
jgi:hypothetical protein